MISPLKEPGWLVLLITNNDEAQWGFIKSPRSKGLASLFTSRTVCLLVFLALRVIRKVGTLQEVVNQCAPRPHYDKLRNIAKKQFGLGMFLLALSNPILDDFRRSLTDSFVPCERVEEMGRAVLVIPVNSACLPVAGVVATGVSISLQALQRATFTHFNVDTVREAKTVNINFYSKLHLHLLTSRCKYRNIFQGPRKQVLVIGRQDKILYKIPKKK